MSFLLASKLCPEQGACSSTRKYVARIMSPVPVAIGLCNLVNSDFCLCCRRTLAIAYRDIFVPFQSNAEGQQWGGEEYAAQKVEKDLTLIALVGIQDPLRPQVPASIAQCHRAGITVRMLTGGFPSGLHHALHCVWCFALYLLHSFMHCMDAPALSAAYLLCCMLAPWWFWHHTLPSLSSLLSALHCCHPLL